MVPFSHGENLYVADMKTAMISSHPELSAVLIGGQGKLKPYLLVEWKKNFPLTPQEEADVVATLIEEANKTYSDLVKLTPELVLFTRPDKDLVRTVKGTISRMESEDCYQGEIDHLYHF